MIKLNNQIKLVLGTMTFGEQLFDEDALQVMQYFLDNGYNELDTAYVYNEGLSEKIIGKYLSLLKEKYNINIATKVNPRITGKLNEESIKNQFNESLKRLQINKVDTLYLHFPDRYTDIRETLQTCAELHSQNKFNKLGLSNFPAWLVVHAFHICKSEGWEIPTIYEGLYNPLSRKAEKELFEALRTFNIQFYAYNPLAGGLLTNKYSSFNQEPDAGRFTFRPGYLNRYWKKANFEARDHIKEKCIKYNIDIISATYRWMAYHSMLKSQNGDAIIIGVSNINQLKENINALNAGQLPDEIVCAFEEAWKICQNDAPEYFRYLS